MRTIFFLFIVMLSVPVFAQQTVDKTDSFLTISKERYTISYPASWRVDTSKVLGMNILFRSPRTDSLDDFMENMNIFVQDLKGQHYFLSKMGQESEAQIKNMITDVNIAESILDSSSLQPFYKLKYTGRQGKYSLTTIQRYYLKDEVGYALTFTIKSGKEADYIPMAERMFNSFKIE